MQSNCRPFAIVLLLVSLIITGSRSFINISMNNEIIKEIRKKKHSAWLNQRNSDSDEVNQNAKRKNEDNIIDLTTDVDDTFDFDLAKHEDVILTVPSSKKTKTNETSRNLQLPLLTYNIWFGPPHPGARMSSIASLVKSSGSYMVGMQEVTPMLAHYLFPQLKKSGYSLHSQDLRGSYGCAIAFLSDKVTVLKSGFLPFNNSIMNRGLLWIHGRINGSSIEILFTTTHLESWIIQRNGAKERAEQVMEVKKFCESYVSQNPSIIAAVLTGDLNWDDQQRPRSKPADSPLISLLGSDKWIDAWKATNAEDNPGYTYDAVSNPMLIGYLKRRFDRFLIYFSDNSSDYNPKVLSSTLIGTNPIPNLSYTKAVRKVNRELPVLPSDHYGLAIDIFLEYIMK